METTTKRLDLSREALVQEALNNKEGFLAANGGLVVETGKRTGRSPKDRFIVQDATTQDTVDWGQINQPMTRELFDILWQKGSDFLFKRPHYTKHLQVGADVKLALPVVAHTEYAWHALFINNLFIEPDPQNPCNNPEWTILNAPSLVLDPKVDGTKGDGIVALDFTNRRVLLLGMRYGGEMKKAMFTALNYFLPSDDVLPMHCAANADKDDETILFFGLSGTGKTTLSSDPQFRLIGDDEHGWSKEGIFNFEGGCYAKCIDLSEAKEPVIWNAISNNTVLENVVVDANGVPDYSDSSKTKNTRAAYPRDHIELKVANNMGKTPHAVIFLTCDLYGVLPPVAPLNPHQAAYFFLSGYTALVGSTEFGEGDGIKPTFSRCFGAPFFPRPASMYADLLMKRLAESDANVYLVNTGWHKGSYGQGGERYDIDVSRNIVRAIANKQVVCDADTILPGLKLQVPSHVAGVDDHLLDPRQAWSNQSAYNASAKTLCEQFEANIKQFDLSDTILQAGPNHGEL